MNKPFWITFSKDVSNDQVMETLGDAITNKRGDIDKHFDIRRISIEDESAWIQAEQEITKREGEPQT